MVQLTAATYCYLWKAPLDRALTEISEAGYEHAELMVAPPHADVWERGERQVPEVRDAAARADVRINSVVPSALDVNLASPDAAMRAWSLRQYVTVGRFGAALGARTLVVHPGRRHPFKPAPYSDARDWVVEGIAAIAAALAPEGVRPVLENTPSAILDTAEECLGVAEELGADTLGICYDLPNGFVVEDPNDGLRLVAEHLEQLHLSDCPADRWAHDPIGEGEIDFAKIARTIRELGFDGHAVVETRHLEGIGRGLAADREALVGAGWPIGSSGSQ